MRFCSFSVEAFSRKAAARRPEVYWYSETSPETGARLTWQLKTDMNIESRREDPGGASGAGATESTVPSAGETIVSSPPSGTRSGSRKKESRKSAIAKRNSATIGWPVHAATAAAAAGGRMKTHPSRATGILSGRPPRGRYG